MTIAEQARLPCTLCGHEADFFAADTTRRYFRCPACGLIFADPESHLAAAAEKAIYGMHENDPSDARYRSFLERLSAPLLARLQPGMEGLDFGCGPGPTLSVMLEEAGMRMAVYDPFYAPDEAVLARRYDFVVCTEVVEHFRRPARDWARLVDALRPGGWLGVMTRTAVEPERFAAWHYKNDPTHVSFYGAPVFDWIAERMGLEVREVTGDAVLFQSRQAS